FNLKGALTGVNPAAAPSVSPAAVLQAPRPGYAVQPSLVDSARPAPALTPTAPAAIGPTARTAPAPQAEPARAIEQLAEALQDASQALDSQGPDADLKTGADAVFDGLQAPAPEGGAPGGIDGIAAAVAKAKPNLNRYIHENLLGWRKIKGVAYDPTLKSLPLNADSDRVIDQISRQFGLVKSDLVALAARYRLTPDSPARAWLAVYDSLQKMNREQFKILDQKKYEGWRSFRNLANKTYAPGWRGTAQRVLEVHKYVFGFFLRFPYHLFDTFVFGYFRQNISFRFFHSHENFLDLKTPDEAKSKRYAAKDPEADKRQTQKWLEQSLRQYAFEGPGRLAGLKAQPVVRGLMKWLVEPLIEPLITFVVRRLTLAVMSAVAMGVLGAFAPALPLSFALTSIPVLGPAILMAAQGIPGFVGMVPFIGPVLSTVVAAAMTALVKDLVLGPILNTFILSTLLTLPRTVTQKAFELRKLAPTSSLSVGSYVQAFGQALVSGSFWKQNLKSCLAMMTVGAEIEGIMTYAGSIDGLVTEKIYKPLTGHEFKVFHTIGAAVERPQGDSPIPFGGAITWGNVLLIKFQDILGIDITGTVMHAMLALKSVVSPSDQTANTAALSAQDSVAMSSRRADSTDYQFDPDLWQKGPAAVLARIQELKAHSGDLQREIAAVKNHMAGLSARLGETEGRIADLKKQSRPITAEELAEYERLLKELEGKRSETYVQSKLAQVHDLRHPQPEDLSRLRELKKMQDYYNAILLPPPSGQDGMMSSLGLREASLKALATHLTAVASGPDMAPAGRLDPAMQESIAKLVAQVEQLREQTRAEMANRDAVKGLLAVANKSRNAALRDRRDGSEMLEFHKNLARLDTVMGLALSLNEIKAAQTAINQMMGLLDNKLAKVNASRQTNQTGQGQAAANQADVAKWRADLEKQIKDDDATKQRIALNEGKTALSASRIQSASQDLSSLIAHVNAEDGGASGDALREYQRRLDLLPQVIKWRTDGGNSSDPDAFSLKEFKDNLAEVEDYIKKAEDGVSRLRTMPIEYAGVAILAVPGPEVTVSNPTKDQVLQILADRKVHWQAKRADYQKSLDSVLRRLDPNNSRAVTDEFGDSNPESLPRWRAQEAARLAEHQAKAVQYLAQLDALATEINRVTGSNIPMLAGMSLTDLRSAIKTYGDKLRAVKFPAGDAPDIFLAKMNLVSAAKLLTYSAHEIVHWAKSDGYITEIDKVMAETLPVAKTKLEGVVRMLDDILADVDLDVKYMDQGAGAQALIDRKINLLQVKLLPPLRDAKDLLQNTLIPWQQDSIKSAQSTGVYFELFDNQKTLSTEIKKLYDRTLPWAFAAFGAKEGDKADGHFQVADFRKTLQDNLNGYDDASGHNKGIKEYQLEMQQRKDPDYTGTEVLYGETQPFSLPRKIAQYTEERARRAAEINTQAVEINEILGKIETLSKGKYDLRTFRLPGDVVSDQAGVDRVQALVDNGIMRGLADQLTAIGNEANAAAGGGISIGAGGDSTVPVGTQPPISVSDQQQIALLALAAGARLVPSATNQGQPVGPCYNAVARFLFADGMVDGAQDALGEQVPTALKFLDQAAKALADGIDSTARDDAYVDSDGASETPAQVYARKAATLVQLNEFLRAGMAFFDVKQGWNQESFGTIDKVDSFYRSMGEVYDGGLSVNDNEVKAINTMRDSLKKTFDDLEATRRKVSTWMNQLNDPNESALRRVGDSVAEIQDKTRAVLETNIDHHKLAEDAARSESIVQSMLIQADHKQAELLALLDQAGVRYALPEALTRRVEDLHLGQGAWAMGEKGREPQALVVRKSEFSSFLDSFLGMFQAQNPGLDISAVKADMLKDPKGLAALIPGSAMLDFGDTADGFYMYYKSQFSVPNGLETGTWATMGNVAQVGGNNISLNGYQFSTPPSEVNAPYGAKGVEVQIESLQGSNWVNYLNVGFHRYAMDVPEDMKLATQEQKSRVLVFDDFAVMLLGDRLYVGLAGFADFAARDAQEKPVYYGGSLKTSLKMTEVMKLTHEQQKIFADDPRKFLQEVNLDFTGYDPDLDQDFAIRAEGDHKRYSRSQTGASFDLARLLDSRDAFTVDLFFSQVSGTDDIAQKAVGATILKGFTIRNAEGKPVVQISNRASAERGDKTNT
ncbi:MAG: hypothetical protein WC881_08770, partial [Elusimicrobiota bacterium]